MTSNAGMQFPKGLLFWAGHRDGGVKKPFVQNSGRPTQNIIRTNLLDKIDGWISELVGADSSSQRVMLLIGGPGNGKTEAVEYLVEQFSDHLDPSGSLLEKCEEEFTPPPGELPARKISISIGSIPGRKDMKYKKLEIVHDATVGDLSTPSFSPEKLLIQDLGSANDDTELLYIACVNRGILSQALDQVKPNDPVREILEHILGAVTVNAEQKSCWPLAKYPHVLVWPMDIESLVDPSAYEGGRPPAFQIFKRALDESQWLPKQDCGAENLCPFHANLEMLTCDKTLANLIKILRHYEISSGKRWTFRELFSLVPQLIVGHENDFNVNGIELTPCDWAAKLVDQYKTSKDAFKRTEAVFYLSSKIYTHALFPRWPTLRSIKKDCGQVLKKNSANGANANDIFRLLGWPRKYDNTSIQKLIREQVGTNLDPVEVTGEVVIAGENISADNLEEMFSYSVAQGYSETKAYLSEMERAFIAWVTQVEKQIGEDASTGNKNLVGKYDMIRKSIRVFACRYVKRSLAGRRGVTKDNSYLERYSAVIEDEFELKSIRKQFNELIHHNSQFPISLATTFGQPLPHTDLNSILYTNVIKVSYIVPSKNEDCARSSLPYLKIKNHAIPLTFPLFKSLIQLREGLMKASIPADILALIEGTRAQMAGEIVRDVDGLEDATLSVGNIKMSLAIHNGKIKVVKQKK